MNAIFGDSRVGSLKRHRSKHSFKLEVEDIWAKGGAKLFDMQKFVSKHIVLHHPPITPGKTHYYIGVGICDLTTKLSIFENNYQEVICVENKTNSFSAELDELNKKILRENGVPVFMTIYPMCLMTWNTLRLNQNKTSELNYRNEYSQMQRNLEQAVIECNNHIIETNKNNKVHTPMVHLNMLRNRKNKKYYLYKMLEDGCHPSEYLIDEIIKSIDRAMALNNNLHR